MKPVSKLSTLGKFFFLVLILRNNSADVVMKYEDHEQLCIAALPPIFTLSPSCVFLITGCIILRACMDSGKLQHVLNYTKQLYRV